MSSHQRNHTAVIRWLLFVCLLYSGSSLEAQIEAPTPVPTQEAPSLSNETADDSELKIQNYQLKHAKAADVLKIWKQLHGIVNGVTFDERTNSIVFFANDEAARELRESLALLDGDAPHPIIPPTPVVQGSSPQAPVPAKSQPRPEKSKPAGPFRKFTFRHAKVADVVKILRELTGGSFDNENMEGFAVDERTNSVIWKVKDEWESQHWEEMLLTLDGESSASKAQKNPSPYRPSDDIRSDGFSLSFRTLTISLEVDRSNTVESLKQRYNELEHQTHQLADKLKQSKSLSESEQSELKAAVRKSFEARQALQRAELADLAQRMQNMQQSIDLRDKLADKVVERRVEDLLNPNLTWDTTPSQEPKSQVTDEPQKSISTSPSQSSIQAAVTRLLARLPHFATPQGDVATAPIAFLGIAYQGPWSLGDFRDELQKEIEAQISQSSSCSLVSRRMTEAAMAETRVKPTDVVTPLVQKNLTQSLRSMDIKVQGLVVARLKHLGDSDSTQNGEFEVSLELFDVNLQSYKERATARNDRSSSKSREKEPQLLQGRWIIESWSWELEDQLSNAENQFELRIDGPAIHVFDDVGNHYTSILLDEQNIEPAAYNGSACPVNYVIDPNGDRIICPGILELDGERLRICYSINSLEGADSDKFRPSLFIPGSKVTLIECRRAPGNATKAAESNEFDLSKPQATLDYLHRYSLAHPGGFPSECYTDEAILELSGMMLQNLSMMSAMSQIALQTGGVIGESNGVPVVSDTSPAFHILVETLLREQMLPTPPESADKAFELLATLTFGSTSSSAISSVQVDRQLLRLAAGVLKSPKEFLPAASKLLETFGQTDADVTKSKEVDQTQPKADIAINGDEATATLIGSGNDSSPSPLTAPRVTKLRRIDGRWLISEILSDEEITQLQSSYSSVMDQLGGASEEKSDKAKTSEPAQQESPTSQQNASHFPRLGETRLRGAEPSKTDPPDWDEFLKLLPESGTALVMFSYEPEIKEQMLPVAKKVTEAASAQLIELPLTQWRNIVSPEATHFVLMKDRQLVGTRTGLMTEAKLQDFVAKAKDWLTPQSTGIAENSLVRIDCFINPGTDNIGSQHGGAYPLTTVVVAVHEDQALLFGPESIAEYIEKGYACVAIVRDEYGNEKQVPMDVLLKGPVKLLGRSEKQPKSAASLSVTFGDGTSREVPLPGVASIYPKSITEPLEAYDVGSAIYHIHGVRGLKPVSLTAIKDAPIVNQRVLSGSFSRERHVPPLHGFRSPIYWQSQTVPRADGHIYGDNINGAEMFEVLCPTHPAPCGFTFDVHGRLIGMYGLGEPSETDMTHTVFKPDTTHSVLQAALEKISDTGLKAALAQTLEESKTTASIKEENSPAASDAANASTSQPSTSPPIKFDTPQALLARLDECSNNGSYEEFVSLFSDDGVRDLAGSLIVSAMQVTTMTDLAKQNGGDLGQGPARVQEALNRWLKPNPTPEQQQAASEALSLMFLVGFGGSIQDKSVITTYVAGIRKSAERVTDFRKFSVDMLKAYHELTGEPFGYFGKEKDREWHVTLTGDKAVATLVVKTEPTPASAGIGSNKAERSFTSNGSEQLPVMTLTNLDGTWRISSLFDELLNVVQPNIEAPSAVVPTQSNSKMITRRYSVGSFVTESFFTGKGNYDTKEVYEKYENEIEQSLQDLAKTVTATCTQPPKFVQVLSSSRCLLIGHTETGHQEIADFMSDIGISNDRIRLRGVGIEITKDDVRSLGIDLTQDVIQLLSSEKAEKLRTFQKNKKSESENSSRDISFVAMDEAIQSGTRTHVKTSEVGLQFPFAARIVPGTKKVQIRMDFHSSSGGVEFFAPRIQSLSDGQSVLFVFGDDYDFYWLATAEIVQDAIVGAESNIKAVSNPLPPGTPAMEMRQRLQGEWDVKVMGISADVSDKRPYQAVVRGQLFLLQCMEDGKVIGTSTWKMIWPEADHPDVVDIVWDPNNSSDEHFYPGRVACDGKSFQVAWRSDDSTSGPAIRPTVICSGDGISYFECVRKQPTDPSPTSTSSDVPAGPKYSGHSLSWWLDSYWDNATAIPKTTENETQEYVASEAIRKLRAKPECKAAIEAALEKWFELVEHEVNEIQLVRAAKCFLVAAGTEHQELAVAYLFKIWRQLPTLSLEKQIERSGEETELNDLLKPLVVDDDLAIQFAERLTNGTSSDRSFVTYYLFSSTGLKDEKDPKVAELNAWLHSHRELFIPAFTAALKDESEHVRWFSLSSLIGLDLKHANVLSTLTSVIESDASPTVRWLAVEMLSSKEILSVAKTQNIEMAPLMIKTLESDSSVDVRYAALGALMAMDKDSELVHATLLEWARCKERLQVEHALSLMLRNHEAGDRPQSIDELIELLSDPEWGTTVEVKQNSYRWARQYAVANLGEYAAHAHRALPTLEAELARNNKDTLSFATEALDSVRGYCPELPIDRLQGEWEFVSMQKPEGSSLFFELQASSDQQPSSVITISGTQLKLGERVLAELSHYRSGSRQGVALLVDPDGKKRHCHGSYDFKGGPSPEYKPNVAPAPELLMVEVSELLNNLNATQATKQIYEFRRVIAEPKF